MADTKTDAESKSETKLWNYRGIDSTTAQPVTGKIRASTEEDALNNASADGVIPISVSRATNTGNWLTGEVRRKASKRDIALFLRGYSTASASNMRAEDALQIAATGVRSTALKRITREISEMYANGVPLHEAFASYSEVFGNEAAAVMEAGEASGQTHQALQALADAKERSGRIRGKIVSSMIYPAVVLSAALLALVAIIVLVLPKVQDVVTELETDLPALTQSLVTLSEIVKKNTIPMLLILVLGILTLRVLSKTTQGKVVQSYIALYVPLFGPVVRGMNTAMLCELCGVMLSAGVTQVRTMELLSVAVRNHVIAGELRQIPQRLINGIEFDAACKMGVPKIDPVIPSLAQQTAAGLSDPGEPWRHYGTAVAEDTDRRADALKSAMEPIMVIVVGVLIGVMAAAVYMPMLKVYDFMNTIQG